MAYTDKLRVVYGDYTLGVHGEGYDYIFSYAQGGLESIVKNGYEWLYRCPKPTFWRALTDNDRGSRFHIKSGSWLSADMFIDCKEVQVIMDGKEQKPYAPDNNSYGCDVYADEIVVKYTYETITIPATTVLVSYTVDVSGKIRVDVHYNGVQGLPEFPVFGMRFIMPTLADKYLYKGLSGETYPDRKAGAKEGIYEINDLSLTQYLVPQECGMRMDTEWLEVTRHTTLDNSRTDSSSQILRIEKNDKNFAFSCLPYTASEIENALHHEELPPARRTVLCVYGAVRGVGGIDSWGTDVEEEYHISAEDDNDLGRNDLKNLHLNANDSVIGLAASGRTPYVIGGLDYAKSIGAYTASVSCVSDSEVSLHCETAVEVITGPEVITGSTRMKAGTAEKMICNMISTGCMIHYGKVFENLMVDVQPTNEKLVVRAKSIIAEAVHCDAKKAEELFEASGKNVKIAILMGKGKCDKSMAEKNLAQCNGNVHHAIVHTMEKAK